MTIFFAIVIGAAIITAAYLYTSYLRDQEMVRHNRDMREYVADMHSLIESQTAELMRLSLIIERQEKLITQLRDIALQEHLIDDWDKDKWRELQELYKSVK